MSAARDRRHEAIPTQVCERGRVAIRDLTESLGVSEATVRRDLKSLADAGELELVYGGATLPRLSDFSFQSKGMRNIEAKRVIGRLAAELVKGNDQVFLDSGTTCFQMAPHLGRKPGLSVVANSTRLAMELVSPSISVILLGGQHRPDRLDTVGPLAVRTLENLRGFTAFVGADGLSMEFGLAASDIESAHLHALVIANAREAVLVADHSKFLSPSLYKIADFDAISRIVTDRRLPDDWMAFLDDKGIDVVYPADSTQEEQS